jgi:hypothetical protein
MLALDKLVPDDEECAQVQSELSKYISEHGVFANLHATKDQDRLNPINGGTCMAPLPHICINWW